MRTDHAFSRNNVRQMEVINVDVVMNRAGTVTALIKREDGKTLQLFMTEEESKRLSSKLSGVHPHIDAVERSPYLKQHDCIIQTPNGAASLEYLGQGRYRVANGAAYIQRDPHEHNGVCWRIEGSRSRYKTRDLAVKKIMEGL